MGEVISLDENRGDRAISRRPKPDALQSNFAGRPRVATELILFPGLRIDLIRAVLESWQGSTTR